MANSKFIAIEGPDGAGKTTVSELISDWLNDDIKKPTTLVKSPGGTTYANAIRNIVFAGLTESYQAEAMGLLTAEVDCFENVILPSLRAGRHVIGDRWIMSGRIYQGFMRNRPAKAIDDLIEASLPHSAAKPSLYIILNASPQTLLDRVAAQLEVTKEEQLEVAADRKEEAKTQEEYDSAEKLGEEMAQKYEAESAALEGKLDYYQCLWAAYEKCVAFADGTPCVKFNTDEQTPEEVADKLREILMQSVLSI